MVRPLGLPVGSVRALLLLAFAAAAVLALRADRAVPPWMVVGLLLAGSSYFTARSNPATHGTHVGRPPLGLPRGTVRLLVLVVVGYGACLWFRKHGTALDSAPVIWILAAWLVGIVVRMIVRMRRTRTDEDAGATVFEHVLALVALLSAAGLVWLELQTPQTSPGWVEPLLGCILVHYFATR